MPTGSAVTTLTPITSTKMNLKLETVDGGDVANVADANVVGGVPVIHRIAIADLAGNTDVVLTYKEKIIDVWVVKTAANAGGAGDTVKLTNVTDAKDITNAIDLNVAASTRVAVTTIDDTEDTIAAGGTLRATAAKVTHCDCTLYVLAVRSA